MEFEKIEKKPNPERNYPKEVFVDILQSNLRRIFKKKILCLVIAISGLFFMLFMYSVWFEIFTRESIWGILLINTFWVGFIGITLGKKIDYFTDMEFKINLFFQSMDKFDKDIDYIKLVEISESKSINLIEKYFTRNDFDKCWYQENKEDQEKTKQN